MKIKLVGSEQACNTTPNSFNASVVRVFSQDDAANYTITQKENPRAIECTINASANATTLLTLSSGNTANLSVGDRIMNSTNSSVVNTDVDSEIVSIVDSTSLIVNDDIIIASGDTTAYAVVTLKTITIQPGKEMFIEKGSRDWLESDEDANVVATAVAYTD